jgi:hypothetical protein
MSQELIINGEGEEEIKFERVDGKAFVIYLYCYEIFFFFFRIFTKIRRIKKTATRFQKQYLSLEGYHSRPA